MSLTIRRVVVALYPQTDAFARSKERLAKLLELARRAYHFLRPHRSVRFDKEVHMTAQRAGLA